MKRGWKPLRAVCWQGFDPLAHVKPRFQSYTHGGERKREFVVVGGFTIKRVGGKFACAAGAHRLAVSPCKINEFNQLNVGRAALPPRFASMRRHSRVTSPVVDTVPRFAIVIITGPVDG